MSFHLIEVKDITTAFRHPYIQKGARIRLVIGVQRNERAKELTFILSIPLPRHHEGKFFMYKGEKVSDEYTVMDPKIHFCDTPRIRDFLNGLIGDCQLEVKALSLSRVVVRYRDGPLGLKEVERAFATACARVYGVNNGEPILMAPIPLILQ